MCTVRLTAMPRNIRRHTLLTLLCVALLLVRVGGSHLHLCFDGHEPPASFHLFDEEPHHEKSGIGSSHQDADIGLLVDMILKSLRWDSNLPLFLLAAVLLWPLLLRPQTFRPALSEPAPSPSVVFLRPPLRGPPR